MGQGAHEAGRTAKQPAGKLKLAERKCVPCEGGVPALTAAEAGEMAGAVPGWAITGEAKRLEREFAFRDFVANMAFINRVADIAEREGHHPDFTVHYNRVSFSIWTHAVGGLTENDFILAAKIDQAAG